MKALILKHTGLSEKDFYKKYPTTDDFFNSKEGKSFKKAQSGLNIDPSIYTGISGKKQRFGSGIQPIGDQFGPQNQPIPPKTEAYEAPYQSPYLKPINNQPSQEEMDSAKDLIKTPKKGVVQNEVAGADQQIIGAATPSPAGDTTGGLMDVAKAMSFGSPIPGLISSWRDEKRQAKEADMWKNVTGLQLKASRTKPERYDRKYVRPEDQEMTGEEFFPIHGVGTNPIAQNGSMIGGNPTEIANNFEPYDIYEDEGYEPLNDSNIKQYQSGGGFGDITEALSGPTTSAVGTAYGNNAGFQTGKAVGDMAKYIPGVGPIVSQLASPVLGAIGGQLDKTFGPAGKIAKAQAATNRNIQNIGFGQQAASVQGGFATSMKDGGYVSNDWQPQVITHYGDYSMKQLLKPDPTMDTLRTGGNMRQNEGEIQSLWGGGVKPESYNPYMDGSGITYNSYGQSHRESDGQGRSGIGISVAQNGGNPNEADVEIERREPIADINGDKVVYGNLFANADLLGDPKAKGKRFKNYVADLNKQENKHTKTLDKNTKALNDLEVYTPFDKLTLNSYQANMQGSDMSLKAIADKKKRAAALQEAINSTRDELSDQLGYTISAEQLSKNGQIVKDKDPVTRIARDGMTIAQDGKKLTPSEAIAQGYKQDPKTGKYVKVTKVATKKKSSSGKAKALEHIPKGQHRKESGLYGEVTPEKYEESKAANPWFDWTGFDPSNEEHTDRFQKAFNEKAKSIGSAARITNDKKFGEQTASARLNITPQEQETPGAEEAVDVEEPNNKAGWSNVIGAALPYIRPSNAMALDPNQLMGELYGLSSNQVEPVQAQSYQPQLDVPYDISLQDQLNQVTSQTRAAQRMAGYNPAAQAAIAAQSYAPANQILGEQFRMNQAEKAQVYDRNRATMNQAKQVNLGLYDQQADRQAQAVANTKAVTQAALNSISSKYQQNALENKTLQTYENLYNYRYGPGMRAYNVNAPFQPIIPTVYYGDEKEVTPSNVPNPASIVASTKGEPKKPKEATSRNGSIVKALKRM